uniref:Uncharacterized protein n=1 Tax=Setaria viridis TaxID=4556 RepID=A0A4U6V2C3_SETVI|nr:hypothetical protein SEVIR_4G278101v2 [Setaria viridis]
MPHRHHLVSSFALYICTCNLHLLQLCGVGNVFLFFAKPECQTTLPWPACKSCMIAH